MASKHKVSREDLLQPWFQGYTHCRTWRRHYKQVHERLLESQKRNDGEEAIKFWRNELEITRQNYRNSCAYAKRHYTHPQELQPMNGDILSSTGNELTGDMESAGK